jgi:CubicO group peptidase (beta-lactamase class C family)
MQANIFILILLVSAGLTPGKAQNIPAALTNYISDAATHGEINGNVLIAENGKVLYKNSYGYQDFARQIPLADTVRFELGSISKTFTAVSVLQLMEKGKLKLDDAFVKYFPGFPYPAITIRQMLSHTSDLPDIDSMTDSIITAHPEKIITNTDDLANVQIYSKTHHPVFTPGDHWSYSSTGYQLLALLVEKLSGERFFTYVRTHIFIPAGMRSTYAQSSLAQTKEVNRALNYLYNNHYEMRLELADTIADKREWTYNLSGYYGAGSVISTTGDMLRYDEALYGNKLLKPSTLEEAFTPVKLNNGQPNLAVSYCPSSYGLGWFICNDTSNGKIVWHSGSAPGVVTLFARNITKHQVYIVLTNVALSTPVYRDMLDIITGKNITYKQPLGYLYGQDAYKHGVDYALAHLNALKNDTAHYALKKTDLERVALEFSRDYWHTQHLALETYKLMTMLYPDDEHIYVLYADLLLKGRIKNPDAATMLYQKALELNPADEKVKKILSALPLKTK